MLCLEVQRCSLELEREDAMSTCLFLSYLLGDSSRNVIMWLDHRAVSQVHRINETKHRVLQYVGGVMSVEMQAPKLLWLKEVSVAGEGRSLIVAERFLHPRVVD